MDARALIAVGVVAEDLSVESLVRFGRVSNAEAEAALAEARDLGLVDDAGSVAPEERARLVADLPVETVAEVHAAVARHLITAGPTDVADAVRHARAAGSLVPSEELVDLADRAGRLNLALHDYANAYALLKVASEFDPSTDPSTEGRRLCDLAMAADGLGRVEERRDLLARAVLLGEMGEDIGLVVDAATAYSHPADWQTGNLRASALLARAASLPLTHDQQVRVDAACGLAEMRIPIEPNEGQQMAWVTRPNVAHPFVDRALEASRDCGTETRAIAAGAWRTIHRSPARLDQRRATSMAALDLAQQARRPDLQVDAAVWLAVDALESADRPRFDEALSVARWVAERDGNPRLRWRVATLGAGAAHLDGDLEEAERLRGLARSIAAPLDLPGWLSAELLLLGEELLARDDPDELRRYRFDEHAPEMRSPVGRAVAAEVHARTGDPDTALRMIQRSVAALDLEASYLFLATRCTDVALTAGATDLAADLVAVLEPWRGHVVVDSNGWWCDGPVALWLARLHHLMGDLPAAVACLDVAEPVIATIGDVRGVATASTLRALLDGESPTPSATASTRLSAADELTERERNVLSLLAEGRTNRQIADALLFSLGTIRADTTSIYRKLGVKGRADAVARAVSTGLVEHAD